MDAVVNAQRSREHLDESLSLFGCPSVLHLAILSEFRLEQIVLAVYTYGFETERTKLQNGCTIDVAL